MNQQIKTIRIFISSTFRDMHSERDYLVKYVFPELRDRCIKKGLSLVDVDLRWGVTEEEAEQGKAIEICLDEIENCKPFFIGILGERYGWAPETYQVPDYEKYDWLQKFEKGHSITALEIYHGVLNKKDMKPRAFFYFRNPAFAGDVPPSKQAEVNAESDLAAKKLYHLKEDIKDVFALNNIPGHIMPAYPCTFKGLKINLQLMKESLSALLTKDDMNLLETLVGDDNLIDNKEYETLNKQLRKIVDQYSYVYLEGLEEFGNEVLENVWNAICEEHPDDNTVTDPLQIELDYHQRFMNSRTRMFIGREDVLGEIAGYISDTTIRKPLMVKGEPGSGKSAIMAIAAQRIEEKTDAGYTIIRFVGASPDSIDINKLVQNIIRETTSLFKITIDEERINDVKVLYEYFREVLYTASTKGKLTLFIDAVNQLLPQYDPHYLVWLPQFLPENVKIVISSIESEYTINAAKQEIPLVLVGELTAENSKTIIHDTLIEYRKTLTEKQIETILSKADAVKPLYLKVACEELRVFPSFELINSRIARLPDSIAELFEQFLERLEADHNLQLVKDTLCLIECSMYGLLESELLELLKPDGMDKLPVNIWSKLYRNLSPYLMNAGDENEGLLEFFHLQLSFAVKNRYLKNDEISCYKKLAEYGLQKYGQKNGNKINTVLYTGIYLYKSIEEEILYQLLRDLFTSEADIYNLYHAIADNLFNWVVNKFDIEDETTLKSVLDRLANNDFPYQFGIFLSNKGEDLKNIGKMPWSFEFLKKSLKISEELVALEPGRLDYRRDLSVRFSNVGYIYQKIGEGKKALEFFEKSLKSLEELVVLDPGSTDFRRNLSVSFNNVGQIYEEMGDGQKAFEFFGKFAKGMEELVALEPDRTDFRFDLSYSFNNVGYLYQQMGEGQKALEFYEKFMKGMEELVALDPDRTDFRSDLSFSFGNVGQIYQAIGEGQKALAFFEKSLKIREELVTLVPDRTDFRRDLSYSFDNVGQIYQAIGEGQKALGFFEKSLKIKEELVANEPGRTDFRRDLSVSLGSAGQMYKTIGEGKKALAFLEKSLKIREELVAHEPGRTDFRSDLSVILSIVGKIYKEMGEGKKALDFFEKSLKIREELVALVPNNTDFRSDLSYSFDNVGQIYQVIGEGQKALGFFEKSLKIKEELVANEPGRTDFRRDLSVSLGSAGQMYKTIGEGKKALAFLEKSLKIREELVALEPGRTDFKSDLSVILNIVGKIYKEMGEGKKALDFFEKSLKIAEELVEIEPGRTDFRSKLSINFNNIGRFYQDNGEDDKAFIYFEKYLKGMEKLVGNEPGRTDFRFDYAASHWNISLVCSKNDKLNWLNKTKAILEPMVKSGVVHGQLQQLWGMVNTTIRSQRSRNSTLVSATDKNINKRSQALAYYQSGEYEKARQLLEELLHDNFEVVSTRMHLARLALITDNLEDVEKQTNEVWDMRKDARNYVVARILWFKLCLEFINQKNNMNTGIFGKIKSLYKKEYWDETSIMLRQIKAILQKEDAFMEWTMQPVLDHIKPQITEQQHALLSVLVDAMSDRQNLEKLNDFPAWRNAIPEEII